MDVRQGGERGLACVLIDDKDDLRRCIRACVRSLSLVDVATRLDVVRPQMGVDAAMRSIAPGEPPDEAFARLMIESTPLSKAAQDVVTALDRLNMPQGDLQVIRMREASLTPSAYLEMVRAQAGLPLRFRPLCPMRMVGSVRRTFSFRRSTFRPAGARRGATPKATAKPRKGLQPM